MFNMMRNIAPRRFAGLVATAALFCVAGPAAAADLAIVQSGGGNLAAGGTANFTLAAINNGPFIFPNSLNATVVETFPAGFIQIAVVSAPGWTCAPVGQTTTCNHPGGYTAGQAFPPIVLKAKANGIGNYQVCANISFITNPGTQADQIPGNNNSCVNGTILPMSHLQNGSTLVNSRVVAQPR
jgi:hypothetical protein